MPGTTRGTAIEGAAGGGEPRPISVSAFCALVRSSLHKGVPKPVRVLGQVSDLARARSGHLYFGLKEEGAVVSCVAWRSKVPGLGCKPREGAEVVVTGSVDHYPPSGRTQLIVDRMVDHGEGRLHREFLALCHDLEARGWFAPERKRPLPEFPRCVVVITSASGAALQDFLVTASQRCAAVHLLFVDVPVQGEGAASQVAEAIRRVDASAGRLGVDAIVVTRGGGSAEDLWTFNERLVAEAVHACTTPLVAAIGHESDTTVIEFVADARAATPTQAAERLVPEAAELRHRVSHMALRLLHRLRGRIERARACTQALAARLAEQRPHAVLSRRRARVTRLATRLESVLPTALRRRRENPPRLRDRLQRAAARHLERQSDRTAALAARLATVGPEAVLARGYGWTTDASGRLVRSIRGIATGDLVTTRLADGTFDATVGPVHDEAAPGMAGDDGAG